MPATYLPKHGAGCDGVDRNARLSLDVSVAWQATRNPTRPFLN
jgi:hypothetical protein